MDGQILLWIQQNLRHPAWDAWVLRLTSLNDHGMLAIAACVVMLLLPKVRRTGATTALSLILNTLVVNVTLKPIIARVRPYEVVEGLTYLGEAMSDFSFPSGHSAAAFAVAVVMYLRLPKRWGVPALLLAAAIALSRLYVGVHYPTDVLAGAAIGALCAFAVCRLIRKK